MYNYEEMIGFRNVKKTLSGKGNGATDSFNHLGGTLKGKSTTHSTVFRGFGEYYCMCVV